MRSIIYNPVKFWLALSLMIILHFPQLLASRNHPFQLTDNVMVTDTIKTGPFQEKNGLLVMEMESTESPLGIQIDLSEKPVGIHFILLMNGTEKLFSYKVIKN